MQLDINEIQKFLPHRYPFLLVDRVLEMERLKRIVAIKNLTINEAFFQGHFPGQPLEVLPPVREVQGFAHSAAARDTESRQQVDVSGFDEQCEIPAADCAGRPDARGSEHCGVEGRSLQN